jgi:hypothetical protein
MLFAGRPAGRAFAALLYLGKDEVTGEVIETIRRRLPAIEFELLTSSRSMMPAWLSDAFYSYATAQENWLAVP